jgi:glycine oxidase
MPKCLLIGQGLAGTFLALELHQRNIDFKIIDDAHPSSASRWAAGLWNPISFKRITAHEKINEYLAALEDFFKNWNPILGDSHCHFQTLLRIFPDQTYANDWDVKSEQPRLSQLLDVSKQTPKEWKHPWGMGSVHQTGWMNVPAFLTVASNYIKKHHRYESAHFDWKAIHLENGKITYQEEDFDKIIFCTGLFPIPSLDWKIPIIPNKGHLLEIHAESLSDENIMHYGNFCIPLGNKKFRIGSTYEWEESSSEISQNIVNELQENFSSHCEVPYSLERAYVGHRPTVKDRNPVIGFIHDQPEIGFFNGLGTKGILQGPYMAKTLVDYLQNGISIPKVYDVNRLLRS